MISMEWFESITNIISLLFGGSLISIVTWKFARRKALAEAKQAEAEAKQKETEAKSSEIDMAQKVQDTYQQILEDKQKEVEDNHRLINELREDRDHYKQGYIEFRDQVDKLAKEFRDFRTQTEDERATMKRDIARNGRQLECLRPFLCGREDCAIRVPVTISQNGELEKTVRPQQKPRRPKKVDGPVHPGTCTADIEPINEEL